MAQLIFSVIIIIMIKRKFLEFRNNNVYINIFTRIYTIRYLINAETESVLHRPGNFCLSFSVLLRLAFN